MHSSSRRRFLRSTLAGAGAFVLPRFAIGNPRGPASRRLNVAVVGVGRAMGGYAVKEAARENLVAMCDVDEVLAAPVYKRHPAVPRFRDFRVMLDKMHREIDAVAISTPDHTHFPAAMAAMERGKHVFVQKPLAHNLWQIRTLRRAARHYKVITQMGIQGHTSSGIRRIKEWIDAGVIGEVREVVTWTDRPCAPWFVPPAAFPPPPGEVPATLDWDLWQGPVGERAYSPAYVPQTWRGWHAYGCGALGDIGCHTFDAPFWALDLGSPTRIELEEAASPGPGYYPLGSKVTYHFPARGTRPPVVLKWYENGYKVAAPRGWPADKPLNAEGGMYMEGSRETLYHGGMRPDSPQLLPDARFQELKPELAKIERLPLAGQGPIDEWYRTIKGEGPQPGANFEYAAPLSEVVLLGALAQRAGTSLDWDAENMKVKGRPDLDAFIREPVRTGWSYGETLG